MKHYLITQSSYTGMMEIVKRLRQSGYSAALHHNGLHHWVATDGPLPGGIEMGAMSRLHDKVTMRDRLTPEERSFVDNEREIIERAKQKQEDGKHVIATINLPLDYVGPKPLVPGNYIVLDLTTDGTHQVAVYESNAGHLVVSGTNERVQEFAKSYHRWFRLHKLTDEDWDFIRKLPTTVEPTDESEN